MKLSDAMLLLGGGSGGGGDAPEAIDFDGTNDYLSRASDFTGNADGKTFTFSCWVYYIPGKQPRLFYSQLDATNLAYIYIDASNTLIFYSKTSDTFVLYFELLNKLSPYTFNHILVSIDMTNTSNRYVYINDVAMSPTYSQYNNADITFTGTNKGVGSNESGYGAYTLEGRLAHVFLDYTYRDLSVEANRRLFITDDLKPAEPNPLIALSPIMYMQLTDPDTWHINSGTGGNFTPNGTVALSERGPGQDNCVASEFVLASSDYLNNASLTGASDSKVFTFSVSFMRALVVDARLHCLTFNEDTTLKFGIKTTDSSTIFEMSAVLDVRVPPVPKGSNHTISVSCDMTDSAKFLAFIDGVDVSSAITIYTFVDALLDFTTSSCRINRNEGGVYSDGNMGELYFDTTYTDLSTDNPFWDSDLNLPKPVRQVLEETGNTPLIAMPIEASNAGLNLGTGGDFTVNSGPFVGARGASEFWARSANFDGSTGSLTRSGLTGISNSKTFTFACCCKMTSAQGHNQYLLNMRDVPGNQYLHIYRDASDIFQIIGRDSLGNSKLIGRFTNAATGWVTILLSIDMTNVNNSFVLVDGAEASMTWTVYVDELLDFSSATTVEVGVDTVSSIYNEADIGFLYFTTDYIDFSDEANRLLFVDALGYPIDLTDSIADGDIPEPLIYMKFDDTTDLGANSGTGGDFTVNGTVTAGSDVDPNA